MVINPSETLVLPCGNETARYRLKGIIYAGGGHFTARLIADNATWTYDGQVNDGRPCMEPSLSESVQLRDLDGRQAHLCVYACMTSSSSATPTPLLSPS
ncbi:hypothetical protein EV702DRAFT_963175 [Suillus placidus]|uniref:Uncharacterized protein n=1 Tax=Suillus placidus TaxID=48579 RepID=A0A9P7A3H0_9AGAM|nr:hypothetical protein EV702DRAFT_963175 [Suillus placidus]